MPESVASAIPQPAVSIILPTYNRAGFLPRAFAAIRAQVYTDWDLIVVDDGSTDGTAGVVAEEAARTRQPVHYIHQQNCGAYGARNTGLEHARGRFFALYDSDDIWLPHHLADCVHVLEDHADVGWVYGACRVINSANGEVLSQNTFDVGGEPRPFRRLRARCENRVSIIEDSGAIRCAILYGLYCGLQNSVIRSKVFAREPFRAQYRNEAEDRLAVIRALAGGHRFAYLDNIHVDYYVHAGNSSSAALNSSVERRLSIQRLIIRGYEELPRQVSLSRGDRRALAQRLSQEWFWNLGYALLWANGRKAEALTAFRRGLRLWPWNVKYWKTYFGALLRRPASPSNGIAGDT